MRERLLEIIKQLEVIATKLRKLASGEKLEYISEDGNRDWHRFYFRDEEGKEWILSFYWEYDRKEKEYFIRVVLDKGLKTVYEGKVSMVWELEDIMDEIIEQFSAFEEHKERILKTFL